MNRLTLLLIFVAILVALVMTGKDLDNQRQLYCRMVTEHFENPAVGWPDYDGSYKEDCR